MEEVANSKHSTCVQMVTTVKRSEVRMPGSAMKRHHSEIGSPPESQEGCPKELPASFKRSINLHKAEERVTDQAGSCPHWHLGEKEAGIERVGDQWPISQQ